LKPLIRAFAGALLLLLPLPALGAESYDSRAAAIDRLLPGQSIRVRVHSESFEGQFATNRSDSLFLHRASERMRLPYSEIDRIDARGNARAPGISLGMFVGALTLGAIAHANGSEALAPAVTGVILGGFLGGVIGGAIPQWHRVYPVDAVSDSTSRR